MPYTLLIASAHQGQRQYLTTQLDADGHTVYDADATSATVAKLSAHAVDVVLLGGLQHPSDSPALLRAIRAGEHRRIHPGQPVVTIGPADEMSALRAYEAGSDHHLPDDTSYLMLRAVLLSVARRALEDVARRDIHVGDLHIDTAAKTAVYNGQPIRLSRREFDVLVTMASDPAKVFSRNDLARTVWGSGQARSGRTVDSHVARLRHRLSDAGATDLVANSWGRGWALLDPMRPRQED
jgi:DNA-binding response OmpR family regulator